MNRVQVLMPMGGLGSRFSKHGYKTPKPLITVDGVAMFLRALQSFKPLEDIVYIFVIREEHVQKYKLDKKILDLLPDAKIATIDNPTTFLKILFTTLLFFKFVKFCVCVFIIIKFYIVFKFVLHLHIKPLLNLLPLILKKNLN